MLEPPCCRVEVEVVEQVTGQLAGSVADAAVPKRGFFLKFAKKMSE